MGVFEGPGGVWGIVGSMGLVGGVGFPHVGALLDLGVEPGELSAGSHLILFIYYPLRLFFYF